MHPVVFISGFLLIGLLFALQEWVSIRTWHTKMAAEITGPSLLEAWGFQYLLLGIACWLLWFQLGPRLLHLDWIYVVTRIVPLSILVSLGVEMAWVAAFPGVPYKCVSADLLAPPLLRIGLRFWEISLSSGLRSLCSVPLATTWN